MATNPAEHVLRTIDDAHIDGHGVYLTEGDVALLWDEILRLRRIAYHAKSVTVSQTVGDVAAGATIVGYRA